MIHICTCVAPKSFRLNLNKFQITLINSLIVGFLYTSSSFNGFKFATYSQCCSHSGNYGNLLSSHRKNISSNHLFSNFFSKSVTFTQFLLKKSESKFTVTLSWQKINKKKQKKTVHCEILSRSDKNPTIIYCVIIY